MDGRQIATLFGAAILTGMIHELTPKIKAWHARRMLLPAEVRNAGFLTDRKLKVAANVWRTYLYTCGAILLIGVTYFIFYLLFL